MSHFSFFPYLLCSPYAPTQIQQNLHSLGYFPYSPNYSNSFSLISSENQYLPLFQQDLQLLKQNQDNNRLWLEISQKSEFPCNSTNINIFKEIHQVKKQQKSEKQPDSSLFDDFSSEVMSKNQKPKALKKFKTKKLSKKQKKQRQMKRNSSENAKRNIIPNQIHQILSIILKKNRSVHLVEKLLSKFSFEHSQNYLSVQRFYLYQSLLKEKINHYANEESLKYLFKHLEPQCVIYSKVEQDIYCKVGLTLISYFLRDQAALIILNSQRIKSSNKLEHLKTKRYLQNFIEQMIHQTFHQMKNIPLELKEQSLQ